MEKKLLWVKIFAAVELLLLTAAVVVGVLLYLKTANLEKYIDTRMAGMENNLSVAVGGISGSVQNALEQQTNVFTSHSYEFGKYNKTNKTVDIILKAKPKTITEGTAVSFLLKSDGGAEQKVMAQKGDGYEYTAVVTVLAATRNIEIAAAVELNGVAQTQQLDYVYDVNYRYQLQVESSYFSGSMSYTEGAITIDGEIYTHIGLGSYDTETIGKNQIAQANVIIDINGVTVDAIPFSLESMQDAAIEGKQDIVTGQGMAYGGYERITIKQKLKNEYRIKPNDILTSYVRIDDTNGFQYISECEQWLITQSGELELLSMKFDYGV